MEFHRIKVRFTAERIVFCRMNFTSFLSRNLKENTMPKHSLTFAGFSCKIRNVPRQFQFGFCDHQNTKGSTESRICGLNVTLGLFIVKAAPFSFQIDANQCSTHRSIIRQNYCRNCIQLPRQMFNYCFTVASLCLN